MVSKKQKDKEKIARFLPAILKQRGWEKQLDLHSIFDRWPDLVSEDAGEHASPLKIERGVLWLEVENSSWLAQLQYEKFEMLDNLNDFLSLGRLSDIKMVLPKKKDKNPYEDGAKSGPAVKFERPSDDKISSFREQVSCIDDEECREALMQFWYLANACKRSEK